MAEFILCDDGSGLKFIRTFYLDSTGAVLNVVDIDTEGQPYTVVGPVVVCASSGGGGGGSADGLTNAQLRAAPVAISGTVDLSAAVLAALETINAVVSGTVALDGPTLAALESITAVVSGTVALDSATLAALESITAAVTGTVSVNNFPTSTEISNDAGNPIPVAGTVALDSATLAALEVISAVVSGTVALDGPTLAALENIIISGTVALDAPTLAALENITAAVTGTVALDAPTLAALESITATVSGTVTVGNSAANPVPVQQVNATGDSPFITDEVPAVNAMGLVVRTAGTGSVEVCVDGDPVSTTNRLPTESHLTDNAGNPYTDLNRLPVELGTTEINATFSSVVSTVNTRTTPLAANEVFVGEWEEVVDYSAISLAIATDQGTPYAGAQAQFSIDGVNVTTVAYTTLGPTGGAAYFTIAPQARYFRIMYTNGPVAQTYLQAEITFRFQPPGLLQAPIGAPTDDATTAQVMKSTIHGRHSSGFWAALKSTIDGILSVNVENAVSVKKINGSIQGTLAAAASASAAQTYWPTTPATSVVIQVPDGHSSSLVELGGTFGPNSQVVFECSDDLTSDSWAATNMRRNATPDVNENYSQIENNPFGTGSKQIWKGTVGGVRYFRVRCAVLAPGDSITVSIRTSEGVGGTFLLGNPPSVSDYFQSGTLAAAGQTVEVKSGGMGAFAAIFNGTWTGKVQVEQTIDGVTWRPTNTIQTGGALQQYVSGTGASQVLGARGSAAGTAKIRLRADTDFVGSITGTIRAGAGSVGAFLTSPVQIAGLSLGSQTLRQSVGTAATRIDPSALANRTSVEVKYHAGTAANNGYVYVGFSSGVTTATGRELAPGESWTLDVTAATQIWAVSTNAAQQVQVTEIG